MKHAKPLHPSDLVLRCLALQRKGYWVAMCVDLDLVVQADTSAQARRMLGAQITSYVAQAVGIDSAHASALLQRKAPLRYRMLYYLIKAVRATARRQSFETAMPMVPVGT
jgi:RecA/RadA recombinase